MMPIHLSRRTTLTITAAIGLIVILGVACAPKGAGLTGTVAIDGSSTVFLITEAIAEEFRFEEPRVRTTVGVSGTGGGFKRFCAGETDLSDASRPITESEKEVCGKHGVEYLELEVAIDGLSILVNPKNDFVDVLTVDELSRIWDTGSKVDRWNQVRPDWPDTRIKLFGPDTESGTFDYFTEVINGEEGASRSDYTASTDDNVLVQGVAGEEFALGYFGYAFYVENQDKLRLVPVDAGYGTPVLPTEQTINDGSYSPLSRPLFLYVNTQSVREKPAVQGFLNFYLTFAGELAPQVGYVPLPQSVYEAQAQLIRELVEQTQ